MNESAIRIICLALILCFAVNSMADTQIIAHRGNSSVAPENTLAAVRAAVASEEARVVTGHLSNAVRARSAQ